MEKQSRIMLALDDSLHSTYAFEWYMDHLYRPGHEVLIANIPHYATVTTPPVSTIACQIIQAGEDEVSRITQNVRQRLQEAGVQAKLLQVTGETGPSIVKAAIEYQADCIITGSRGFGAVKRTLIGSVSDYILHHAHCPVLVCQRRDHAKNKITSSPLSTEEKKPTPK